MLPIVKTFAQQLNFHLGRNPRLEKKDNSKDFIPESFKAVVVISADFELAWAWRYTKSSKIPLKKSLDKAKLERENMPKILALCEQYNIPITWLTVGHLFLESCKKSNGLAHPEMSRPSKFENDWWLYQGKDWFEYDPCTDYKKDPLWYCPDLIEAILESKVNHEIGCHTFSHIDCRNEVCSPELFRAEIEACQKAANRFGIENMKSFVHPGHTIGNLATLAEMEFTSYRTDYANILGYPHKKETGLWEFTTTLDFDYKPNWSNSSQINRYISTFKKAIRNQSVAYMWFHPSFDPAFVQHIMPAVFEWLDNNREKIWIANTREYVDFLNKTNCN